MIFNFRSLVIVVAAAGYAHAAPGGDEKAGQSLGQFLIGTVPASAWSRPSLVSAAPQIPARATSLRAGLAPAAPSSFLGRSEGTSRLLFLSPLSPLRATLRVAAQDLATQTRPLLDSPAQGSGDSGSPATAETDSESAYEAEASVSARRREVILRQRRRSVLNERDAGDQRSVQAPTPDSDLELSGLSGRVELLTLPAGSSSGETGSIPNGAGLVRVSGHLTEDLSFALTGLAADSAATTWRGGAEFELAAGDRNRIEVGAVYGTRFNATNAPVGGEVDRRSVGAFRVVHELRLLDNLTTSMGGRYLDAPFLASSRSFDPELSLLLEEMERNEARTYLRLDFKGDTLFPGLEVVAGESDVIALSEGLPILVRGFEPQRTWTRALAMGYGGARSRMEARIQDQSVDHALLIRPSSLAGAPFVTNASRNRVQIGSVMLERTFGSGQGQAAVEYGYGRFAVDGRHPGRERNFHQVTTRFDAYSRRTGTGIAVFHRWHEGAPVTTYEGDEPPVLEAHRYLIELRQDVPFVPAMIGADMALLVSLRNVYYDDVERRNLDEFAVAAPPRRVTGGLRVKF